MAGFSRPGQWYDTEGELVLREVNWPSPAVLGPKLNKLVDEHFARNAAIDEANRRLQGLTRTPGKYEQKVPLHLQPTVEEQRAKVADANAKLEEAKATPAVAPEIKKLVPAELDKMKDRAVDQNAKATAAYLAAIDALENARNELSSARTDLYRVRRLQGEEDFTARHVDLPRHVGHGTDVSQVLGQMRAQVGGGQDG